MEEDKWARAGKQWPADEAAAFRAAIAGRYDREGSPYYASTRLWDDGVIDPADTRRVVGAGASGREAAGAEGMGGMGEGGTTSGRSCRGWLASQRRCIALTAARARACRGAPNQPQVGLSLAAALNAPAGDSRFGVFRM